MLCVWCVRALVFYSSRCLDVKYVVFASCVYSLCLSLSIYIYLYIYQWTVATRGLQRRRSYSVLGYFLFFWPEHLKDTDPQFVSSKTTSTMHKPASNLLRFACTKVQPRKRKFVCLQITALSAYNCPTNR